MNWLLVPDPYPDELFYSVIARWITRSGILKMADISSKLSGRPDNPQITMPTRLQRLTNNLPMSLSIEKIIFNHTLYPYYSAFAPDKFKMRMRKDMIEGYTTRHKLFYFETGRNLVCCPECLKEDIQIYGEPYWHRVHHLPNVLVCPQHNTLLIRTCPICREYITKYGRSKYEITPIFCPNGHNLIEPIQNNNELLLQIAIESQFILGGGLNKLDLMTLRHAYYEWIRNRKFDNENEYYPEYPSINYDNQYYTLMCYRKFRKELNSFCEDNILKLVSVELEFVLSDGLANVDSQLYNLFVNINPEFTLPFMHVIIMQFMYGGVREFAKLNNIRR